jgi:signal transduction histidine kinase
MSRLMTTIRSAVVGLCLVSAAFGVAEMSYRRPGGAAGSLLEVLGRSAGLPTMLLLFVSTLSILAFAALFWIVTRPESLFRADSAAVVMMVVQALIGMFSSMELLPILAIEVAFVLQVRKAVAWVMVQSLLPLGAVALQIRLTGSHPLMSLFDVHGGKVWIPMALMAATSQIWNLLALALGFLAAGAERQSLELRRVNAELRATQMLQAQSARLAERLSISRDLHDSSGHHLTALSLTLRLMRRIDQRDQLAQKTEECLHIVQQLLSDVRGVVKDLRDVGEVDLKTALDVLSEGIPGLRVHLKTRASLGAKSPHHVHALFRCCQEILTNAARHSGARNVWIEIFDEPGGIHLTARDDGRGASEVTFGNGLKGMQERTSELGGRMEVHTRRGEGFLVTLSLPLRNNAA